ncbi:MAG: prenyltransferase/squalene oxidase repeat-containing protein [Phycisphaerae bacterium]
MTRQMRAAAGRARIPLRESADLVADFLLSLQCEDGGFRGRAAHSDLYYSAFALQSLASLEAPIPSGVREYLNGFDPATLDLVHLGCLARALAALPEGLAGTEAAQRIHRQLDRFRAEDGGYAEEPNQLHSSAYASFFAVGVCEDTAMPVADVDALFDRLEGLATPDGAYTNSAEFPVPTTPNTAAAVVVHHQFDRQVRPETLNWLEKRFCESGGFLAIPDAPMPDLLSTAVTLQALSLARRSLESFREPCLDFMDELWTGRGAFRGYRGEREVDCEFTFYGLLGLGLLTE